MSLIPTPCLVHSRHSINNYWQQEEREERREKWGTRIEEGKERKK